MKRTKEKRFVTLSLTANNYTIREETLSGRNHLVVPVVMMVEGVHAGSGGPMLHQESELQQGLESWNGIPVTIAHPENGEGLISANSPEVLDQSVVGRIFNTTYNRGLKAEVWIDVEKISEISPTAHGAILNGNPLEVSVGVYNDIVQAEEGAQWNGETYESIASNYKPDHLALLPGETGACSWIDGCGIRANQKGVNVKELLQTFKQLSLKGYVVSLLNNEQGYREILEALQTKINTLDTESSYHYIEEVYDDYIIYRQRVYDGGGETLYRQEYAMDTESNINFNGMRSEVRKKVEYVTMRMVRTKISNNKTKGGTIMSDEKNTCCEAKVDALISNKQTHWVPNDRDWLLTLEEATLAKMSPMESEERQDNPAVIQANKDTVVEEFKTGLKTIEDYTVIMPDMMKAMVEKGMAVVKANRETLVKGIMDNTEKDVWNEDVLNAMDDSTLESVSKSIKQPTDFSALGAGGAQAASGEGVEIPVEYANQGKEDK